MTHEDDGAVVITTPRRPTVEELRELRSIEEQERAALEAWRRMQETGQ